MRKGTTTERGYGWEHQKARAGALAVMPDGQPCTRCGGPMYRVNAKSLDLDHSDDRRTYRGLAHRSCNRRAGQAKAIQSRRSAAAPSIRSSRAW